MTWRCIDLARCKHADAPPNLMHAHTSVCSLVHVCNANAYTQTRASLCTHTHWILSLTFPFFIYLDTSELGHKLTK